MASYQDFFREKYQQADPWNFGTNVYEKVRHAAMAEFTLFMKPQTVLDLGCGEGHFLEHLLQKGPGIKAEGVELEPAAAERCRARLKEYGVTVYTADLLDFLQEQRGQSKYDAIVCGDVLYFLEPEVVENQVVPGIASLLQPKGGLILSYADVNSHEWTVKVFEKVFNPIKQVYVRPVPSRLCSWLIALMTFYN